MVAETHISMIYFGRYPLVDLYEGGYLAERAELLRGQSADHETLQVLKVRTFDANHDGVMSDDDICGTHDRFLYTLNETKTFGVTDATMTWQARLVLQDGSQTHVELVAIQTNTGDVFLTDLLDAGSLDNLSISKIELIAPTGTNYPGWYSNQSVDGTQIVPPQSSDGHVDGTNSDDVIDLDYTGDPDGDRIDAGDAVLPGQAAQDDIVRAYGGDDRIDAGAGDDTVFAGTGDDMLIGGQGDDLLKGEAGDDILIGGAGADDLRGGKDADRFIITSAEEADGDRIDGGSTGNDMDVLDLRGSGPFRIVDQTIDADGNSTSGKVEFVSRDSGKVVSTLSFTEVENIVPCFTPGTSIATPRGEMLVEDLQIGDKIITRDNGVQEIRWIGAKRMDGRHLQLNPHLQPILLQRGSLGSGLPERDMLVSPNHRMLVNNDRVPLYFEDSEVLVSAKHLVNPQEGVQSINSMGTTYIHFMFDRHEVILSNGAWSESFQPGDYSLKGVGNAQRNELFEIFPQLQKDEGRKSYAAARLTLKKNEARMLFR